MHVIGGDETAALIEALGWFIPAGHPQLDRIIACPVEDCIHKGPADPESASRRSSPHRDQLDNTLGKAMTSDEADYDILVLGEERGPYGAAGPTVGSSIPLVDAVLRLLFVGASKRRRSIGEGREPDGSEHGPLTGSDAAGGDHPPIISDRPRLRREFSA